MNRPLPPLNALRAFEVSARHLSLTRAAQELHVTAGALSHQIRNLEEMLGVKLFERRVRSIALTAAGKLLYPGLQTGFTQIQDAVAGLQVQGDERVLVVSTPPGFTAKWLAPRLYRFASAHPEIDARISSSFTNANFMTDGVDIAVRNMPGDVAADATLEFDKLIDMSVVPLCSPKLVEAHGPLRKPEALARLPLIHDDTLVDRIEVPNWADWFRAAGVANVDVSRGLRFNSADHALDAAGEGAGVLLAQMVLAYDDLRTGRLTIPFDLPLPTNRAYYIVWPRRRQTAATEAFRAWLKAEIGSTDWARVRRGRGKV
jgi:LysR family glycine cleavage system transcriptional activator